jgi:hypothetical protein
MAPAALAVVNPTTADCLADLAPRYRGYLGTGGAQNGADEARIEVEGDLRREGNF